MGNVYYVAPTGSDKNPCSQSSPCQQIRQALTLVHPGDLISVADGSYLGFDVSNINGKSDSPITIRAQAQNAVVTVTTDRADNRDTILITYSSYIVIDGLHSSNANRAAVRVDNSPNVTIQNGVFGNNAQWGIFTDFSDDLLIQNNQCFGSVAQHGIYVSDSSQRPVIKGNTVYNNAECGIQVNADASDGGTGITLGALVEDNIVYGNGAKGGAGLNFDGVQDSMVINNLVYNNLATGIANFQSDGAAGPLGMQIYNNTVVQASGARNALQFVDSSGGGNIIRNNILYHPDSAGHAGLEIGDSTDLADLDSDYNVMNSVSYNGTIYSLAAWQSRSTSDDPHSLASTPTALFMNAAAFNFNLQPAGPAVDAGVNLSAVTVDILGAPRPHGKSTDIGAYENQIQIDPTPAPTTAPTPSPTPSPTPKPTATPTPSPSPTPKPTTTPVPTPSPTPKPTATPVPTPSPTPKPTATPKPSAIPKPSATPKPTPTPTPVGSPLPSPSDHSTPRILLTPAFLNQLRSQATAANPAWVALKADCDQMVAANDIQPPNGIAYPNPAGSVGQGYEGETYLPAMREIALCYQMVQVSDPTTAAKYGSFGAALLNAMSLPQSAGGEDPSIDDGYVIRNFGVGMAIGLDWLYPVLSPAQRAQAVTSLNSFVDWFDASGFENGKVDGDGPVGNYFAGYFAAKVFTVIATNGETGNKATTYWNDLQIRMWAALQPVIATGMAGGGWPEGWEYGPLSIRNLVEGIWAAQINLGVSWMSQVNLVKDEAAYLNYFSWPSEKHMDDQGTIHSGGQLYPSLGSLTLLSTVLNVVGDSYAPTAQSFAADAVNTIGGSGDDRDDWETFMYWNKALPQTSYTAQPLSYLASGSGQVAMRSDWTKAATWAEFSSGPYVDSGNAGEQLFNQGSVTMAQGDVPILINEAAWGEQAGNNACETQAYNDEFNDPIQRNIFNTFYVAMPSGAKSDAAYMGQDENGPFNFNDNPASTRIQLYEDGGSYVHSRGVNIEQMYFNNPMSQFTRDVVYLRPDTLVIYDRTTVNASYASDDQWLSFYTPALATQVSVADASQRRYDITYKGVTGSIHTLLPANANTSAGPVSGCTLAFQFASHASAPQASTDWLTTVVANNHGANQVRLSNADGNVTGPMVGVLIQDTPQNHVVLFNNTHAANGSTSTTTYTVAQTAAANHVLVDMVPNTGYSVTAAVSGSNLIISVAPGGSIQSSATGVLSFTVTTSGSVQQQ